MDTHAIQSITERLLRELVDLRRELIGTPLGEPHDAMVHAIGDLENCIQGLRSARALADIEKFGPWEKRSHPSIR